MGMPVTNPTVTTADQYFALPENRSLRDELLDGQYVVTPQPSVAHELIVSALFPLLHAALVAGSLDQ